MKNIFSKQSLISLAASAAVLSAGCVSVTYAEIAARVNLNADVSVKTGSTTLRVRPGVDAAIGARIEKGKERAEQEIARRIEALGKLTARVGDMRRVSSGGKTSLNATVDAEIANLNALKTKIAADIEIDTLKADIQSITKSYRIFALVIPQGHLLAMADRVNVVAETMSSSTARIRTAIATAKASGQNVTVSEEAMVRFDAKLGEARVSADAASKLVTSLSPDNGSEAVFQANKKALGDARVKLQAAQKSLKDAREEARAAVVGLKEVKVKVKTEMKGEVETQ
jgi:hypothetical protein